MNRITRLRPASLVASAVALVLAQSAFAQETTTLGEITVTARKRAESLQDVPFAISARTGEQLAAAGATNIEDVSRNVAGLSVLEPRPGTEPGRPFAAFPAARSTATSPASRSRSASTWTSPSISLSLFTPDLDLYDLNRVEVLRGPQGTLFGSGSTGRHGALHQQPAGPFGRLRRLRGRPHPDLGRRPGRLRSLDDQRAARRPRRAARRRLLQRVAGLHRCAWPRRDDRRGRERRPAAGRSRCRCAGS